MASSALDEMFEEIEGLLEAQHSLSARWYARHSGMPVDEARATLEAYLKKRGKGKASATFLLGGTPASGGGQAFKLASAAALDGVKAGFSTITTEQLYSLHAPAMPDGDALPLAAIATAQDKSLYEQVRAMRLTSLERGCPHRPHTSATGAAHPRVGSALCGAAKRRRPLCGGQTTALAYAAADPPPLRSCTLTPLPARSSC